MSTELWIFGYGSLLWRPDFPFSERRGGFIRGWSRQFWQGSVDHRGLPHAPGRVVTLTPVAESVCWGAAYRVSDDRRDEVFVKLDHRESGGFERVGVDVTLTDDANGVSAITYIAPEGNPNYLGPAPTEEIAEQVRVSEGPSGHNLEYALRLAESLRSLGVEEDPVFELARLLEGNGR